MARDPISEEVFRHLFTSIPEEMGVTLERTAYSPNIKERRDHSCALFDPDGALVAQAAHIPVHLGAFPQMMRAVVPRFRWEPGDAVLCNDPFVGGTHLPDISLVTPLFTRGRRLAGFVASRAHHADVGGAFAGSMGAASELFQEGVIVPPVKLLERGVLNESLLTLLLRNVRTPEERRGDLAAQMAANATGSARFAELMERYGAAAIRARTGAARRRSQRAVTRFLASFPGGEFSFTDRLDPGTPGGAPLPISVRIAARDQRLHVDFSGSAPQQTAPINAPFAVTCSAVYYVLICLLPEEVELNQGVFDQVKLHAPEGTLVNPRPPAAVAGGNVETSQRIVDALLGALSGACPGRTPAASQGSMNNLTVGGQDPQTGQQWAYYETLGGGAGASPEGAGVSGVHVHMSNTRNTPAEALEYHYPLRVRRYALRDGSGGEGVHPGGDGVIRELELLGPATVTLLTDRRATSPYGLAGGRPGAPGKQEVCRDGVEKSAPARGSVILEPGDRVRIFTPGGGGWGD